MGGAGGPVQVAEERVDLAEHDPGPRDDLAPQGRRAYYAYLYLYLPAGTGRLTLTASGGTGNADLYYSAGSWATTSSYTQRSTGQGNAETLVVDNPPAGYVYVSLHAAAAFDGASVKAEY